MFRRRGAGDDRQRRSLLKFPSLRVVRTVEESKAINDMKGPAVIMATSGMCTAGRIKHHLAHNIGNPACTILFVGYQSQGTLGRQILDGNREVRIHGISRLVRAQVGQIQGISGHADRDGLLRWLGYFRSRRGSYSSPTAKPKRRSPWPKRSAARSAGTSACRSIGRR